MAAVADARRGPPDADGARMNRFAHPARRIQLDETSRIEHIPGPAPGRRRSHLAGHRLVGPRRSVGVDATPGDRDRRPDRSLSFPGERVYCGWVVLRSCKRCVAHPGAVLRLHVPPPGTRLGVAYPDPSLRSSVTPVLWTHCLVPRQPRPDLPKVARSACLNPARRVRIVDAQKAAAGPAAGAVARTSDLRLTNRWL